MPGGMFISFFFDGLCREGIVEAKEGKEQWSCKVEERSGTSNASDSDMTRI
jgi:hypothetical protein